MINLAYNYVKMEFDDERSKEVDLEQIDYRLFDLGFFTGHIIMIAWLFGFFNNVTVKNELMLLRNKFGKDIFR